MFNEGHTRNLGDKAEYFVGSHVDTFLLRKRNETKANFWEYVNTNENYYQFQSILILLAADFVICVVEIHRG